MWKDYSKEACSKRKSQWKREKLPLPKTKIGKTKDFLNKKEGNLGVIVAMFFLLVMMVVFCYQIYLAEIVHAGRTVEDALVAAELAAAVVDLQELGKSGKVCFEEIETVHSDFMYHLRNNLQMDTEGRSKMEALSVGPITVEDFRVYEVMENEVIEHRFGQSGKELQTNHWEKGLAVTPDGINVMETSIYGKCRFYVRGMNDTTIMGEKEKTVDIKMTEKE